MPNVNETIKAHSDLGASVCERNWHCSGAVDLIRQAPEPAPSQYAAEGTVAHAIAAECITRGSIDYGYSVIGQSFDADGFEIEVTEDMIEAVEVYVSYVLNEIAVNRLEPSHIWIEERVHLPGDVADLYGTVDAGLHYPYRKLAVIDYKHGKGVRVEVTNNKQAMYYAVGLLHAIPDWAKDDINEIELIIVQPRCPGGGISKWSLTVVELLAFEAELHKRMAAVGGPESILQSGSWCKFCPANPICPALRAKVGELAQIDFQDVNPTPALPAPQHLSPETLAKFIASKSLVIDAYNRAEEYALQLLEQGVEIPGLKLVAKRSNRKFSVPESELVAMILTAAREQGIAEMQTHASAKLLSVAQMEKAIQRAGLTIDLSTVIEKPDSGNTLAVDSDYRTPRQPKAVQDFAGVTIDI